MEVKIYKVKIDLDYSVLKIDDFTKYQDLFRNINEVSLSSPTECMKLYIDEPLLNIADFVSFECIPGTFLYNSKVHSNELGVSLNESGKEIECIVQDTNENYYLIKINTIYNCLNLDQSVLNFTHFTGGKYIDSIQKYSFYLNRIGDSDIFKIPETYKTEIYCISGRNKDFDFYTKYNELSMNGLLFEEIWSAEID